MAAAGLIDEKEENGILKCGCIVFLFKIIHRFYKHKSLILVGQNIFNFFVFLFKSKEPSLTKPEEAKSMERSFWRNISPRGWRSKMQVLDMEEGMLCRDNNNGSNKRENNVCTNRKRSSAKVVLINFLISKTCFLETHGH